MRTMALDVGNKRIGVALSDPTGTLAQGIQIDDFRQRAFLRRRPRGGRLLLPGDLGQRRMAGGAQFLDGHRQRRV